MDILLSKSTWFIIKWVCEVLGVLMNGIYIVLDTIGIPNIGLAIIFFTIIIYLILTPIQIKQQKFSKMTSVMQPELQKIQKKYQGKERPEFSDEDAGRDNGCLSEVRGISNRNLSAAFDSDANHVCLVSGYLSYSWLHRKC